MPNTLEKIIHVIGKGQPKTLADYAATVASIADACEADASNPDAVAILEMIGKAAQPKNLPECREVLNQIHFAASERAAAAKRTAEKAVAATIAYRKTSTPTPTAAKGPSAPEQLLAAIDAAAEASFTTSAQASATLAGIVAAAGRLSPAETQARGYAGLLGFIGRCVAVRENGRPFAALGAIKAIHAARIGMIPAAATVSPMQALAKFRALNGTARAEYLKANGDLLKAAVAQTTPLDRTQAAFEIETAMQEGK